MIKARLKVRLFVAVSCFLFLVLSNTKSVSATPLGELRSGPLNLQIERVKSELYRLTVKFPGKRGDTANVFAIENPVRLVVDLPAAFGKGNQSLAVKDIHVTGLRLGAHPDKTRIVVDIQGEQIPKYTFTSRHSEPGTLHIDFAVGGARLPSDDIDIDFSDDWPDDDSGASLNDSAREDTKVSASVPLPPEPVVKEEAPKAALEPAVDDSLVIIDEEAPPAPKIETARLDEPKPDPIPADFTGSVVSTIYYQTLENTRVPAVAFELSKMVPYSMNQIKSDLFELTIENSRLSGKHLKLPQFPPDTFKGFQVVVAREERGKVLVRIYVEEGAKLFPFVAKGNIWVKISGITNP